MLLGALSWVTGATASMAQQYLGSGTSAVPRCTAWTGPGCSCPPNTVYRESTTWATIGANALDVQAVAGRCTYLLYPPCLPIRSHSRISWEDPGVGSHCSVQDTDWFGTSPDAISGPDNSINATRTLTGELPIGKFEIVERLYGYRALEDGSFTHFYDIGNAPIDYPGGSFWGDWDVLDATALSHNETAVVWAIYACFTVDGGFEPFHESGIHNITDILKKAGKATGYVVPPYSKDTAEPYTELLAVIGAKPQRW